MRRKLYAKYNRRSKMIEFVFLGVNDDEALFNYNIANDKAESENKWYRAEDYALICLGVIEMEGAIGSVGIVYEYAEEFPIAFDEIKDGQIPKYNQKYFNEMKVSEEKTKEIRERANL